MKPVLFILCLAVVSFLGYRLSSTDETPQKPTPATDIQPCQTTIADATPVVNAPSENRVAAKRPAKAKPETEPENEEEGKSMTPPEEAFFNSRFYPDRRPDIDAYLNSMQSVSADLQLRGGTTLAPFDQTWVTQGPGNIGARINTIAVDPTDEDIIYIGYSAGGIWKTVNGGINWFPMFDNEAYLAISCITIDPSDHNTIYVGTGDHNIGSYYSIGDGVYKSTNGGVTWTNIGLAQTRIISEVIVDPTNPQILWAATMGLPAARNNDRGLYKSIDGGANWTQSLFVSDTTGIIDIMINPSNPQTMYAASWSRFRDNVRSIGYGLDGKVWKTTNGGSNWTALTGGLPTDTVSRIGLAMSAQDPNKIFALYVDYPGYNIKGVYKSLNAGGVWTEVPTIATGLDPGCMGGFGWYFGKIIVNPTDDDDIHILGVDNWRTTDGGGLWEQSTPFWFTYEVHADKHDMAFLPNGDYLLATDGGLYKYNNDFGLWEDLENIPATQFYRIAHNPHDPESYYGGAQDNGTTGGNLQSINFWPRIFGGDGFQPRFNPDDPNYMYAETQNGGLVASNDGGANFYPITTSFIPGDRISWDMPYNLSHFNSSTLYAGTQRMYRMDNGPFDFWYPISPTLTDSVITSGGNHVISTLDESPQDELILYSGTSDGNVWRTLDGGVSWDSIHTGLPVRYVSSVHASPTDAATVFVTHCGYRDGVYTPHVHVSDNNGDTWTDITGDLPQMSVNDIYIHNDSVYFVATDAGVYGTVNSGQAWHRIGNNMPLIRVFDVDYNPFTNELVAGTHARSIMTFNLDSLDSWLSPVVPVGIAANAERSAIQVYPSVASTQINIDLPADLPADATFGIHNVLGGASRQYTVAQSQIDISEFPAGNYIVILSAGTRRWTGRFIKI